MNTKLKTPNIGYSVEIKFENPINEIGSATIKTANIACLYFTLKLLVSVLLMEYTSETSVENISANIIIKSII